ncbi:hypothetical protein ACSSS7_000470 [Eimeria intestinalis]
MARPPAARPGVHQHAQYLDSLLSEETSAPTGANQHHLPPTPVSIMSGASASPSPAASNKPRASSSSSSTGSMKTPIGGEDVCALVVQVGGCSVRVGYAQEDHPRVHASALVGRRRLRLPPKNATQTFCGACCCCEMRAAATAPPDVDAERGSSSNREQANLQRQNQQQPRWSRASGTSPSVFYSRGPFVWPSEGKSCCGCSCSQQDLLFPVNLGVATPNTEVFSILSVEASAAKNTNAPSEDNQQQQQKQQQRRPVWHVDREAFSTAVRVCIEGHVPPHETQGRTIRPPKVQENQHEHEQLSPMKQEGEGCKCCCAKHHKHQLQQSDAVCFAGLPDDDGKCKDLKEPALSSCSVFEAFGCSPFGGLGVWTHEHPLLVVEPTLASASLRETLAAAVFEDLQVPAAFFASAAATAAFAMGRSSALVVELGSLGGSVAAVCDGYMLRRSTQRLPIGGNFLDRQIELVLLQQLQQQQQQQHQQQADRLLLPLCMASRRRPQGRLISSSCCNSSLLQLSTAEVVRQVREACCAVRSYGDAGTSLTSQQQQNKAAKEGGGDASEESAPPSTYELPDGTQLDCCGIRHAVGELLFQPQAALEALQAIQPAALRQDPDELLQGFAGLPSAVADCVYASDVDVRRDLLSAVILTGGLSLTPGLAERFSDELHSEAFGPCSNNSGLKVRVVCPSSHTERRSAAWLGGSILASLGTFQEMWISKQEYEEHGAAILEKRSF